MKLDVTPRSSLLDAPLQISVRGLPAGQRVRIAVNSTDAHGTAWSAGANYRADARGRVDLTTAPSLGGSYTGVLPMGIIMSMQPPRTSLESEYFWYGVRPNSFTFSVLVNGQSAAATSIKRSGQSRGVVLTDEHLASTGFEGIWGLPPGSPVKHTAVLMFGGSEGGMSGGLLQSQLVSHGYPTLQIAYFGETGLPGALGVIPLEYFANALTWMTRQLQVDPSHIVVMSGSRGSEAAFLLGVHYPNLVHGVVASSPSDDANVSAAGGPSWTYGGQPVPTTSQWNNPAPTDNPAAVFPVEHIDGPILTDCGRVDREWGSCAYAAAIKARLDADHDPYPHPSYAYPAAGHLVDGLVPYEPIRLNPLEPGAPTITSGATPYANDAADANLWPHVLAFLATI